MGRGFRFAAALFVACRVCAAAPEQWTEVRSPHFTVITNDGEKQGRHVLDQFERMRWVFQTLFPNVRQDASTPIEVIAAKNSKTFQGLEPEAYLAKGQITLGGYFLRTQYRNYVLLRMDAQEEHPFATVYHEYTHFEFSKSSEWMPLWLNEGLAEFFQNTEIRNKDVLLGEPSRDNILFLRQQSLIPLPVLFKVDQSSPYYHEEHKGGVFYAEAWALTHFLQISDRENKTHRLDDYINHLAQHEDAVTAAEKAFGDLKKLQSELQGYIQMGTYKQFVMSSAAAPIDESAYEVRTMTQEDADCARADVLVGVNRVNDARALVEPILKADPNNAQAHEVMGMAAFRENNQAEALKWFGEAVKLNSNSFFAHFFYAEMTMAEGDSGGDSAQVETSLREAIRLNPGFAPAYNQLAMFYGMRREKMDEALKLISKAVELDPGVLGYRLNAASVLMGMSKYENAEKVLSAAMRLAKSPQDTAAVESRLDQVKHMEAAIADRDAAPVTTIEAPGSPRVIEVAKDTGPKHPTEAPTGTKHFADGVMRGVTCSYPSTLEFRVEGQGKPVDVYTNNYFKMDLSALGFTPKDNMNPCTDFEGRKARVQYAEVSDKSVDGQVVAVELRK
ncbi:MAG TPA: tetratricopeptide repeat protein [Terracidiphilus sp.]|nr:tetratricopeptide repeat protein [Terracidiphilus sp.]